MLRMSSDAKPLGALLLLTIVFWIPISRGPIDLRWDAGVYYVLGTSIAQGTGYRIISEPGNPQEVQYPPLLPLLIAGHERLLGTSDPVVVGELLRKTFGLMVLGAVALTYLLARRWLSPWQSFLAGLVYILSRMTYFLATFCYAETPFTLLSLLFFVPQKEGWRREVTMGGCAIAAYLLRAVGIALLVAWVAESVSEKQWRRASVQAALAVLSVLLWLGYVSRVTASYGYQHPAYAYQRAPYLFYNVPYNTNIRYLDTHRPELGPATLLERLERTVTNLPPAIHNLGETVAYEAFPIKSPILIERIMRYLPHVLGLGLIFSIFILARRAAKSMVVYIALSILLIILTPWPGQFGRYMAPLIPLIAIAYILSLVSAYQWIAKREDGPIFHLRSSGLVVLAGAMITCQGIALTQLYTRTQDIAEYRNVRGITRPYRLLDYGKEWKDFDMAVDWLRDHHENTPAIGTSCPQLLYLALGSKTVMPPMEANVAQAQKLLDSVPVGLLIVDDDDISHLDNPSNRYTYPVVRAHPELWKRVFAVSNSKVEIYQRTDASADSVPQSDLTLRKNPA
jgi:hypothetical protein